MRNSPVVTKDSEEGGRGGSSGMRAEWPVPLKPMEQHREADLHPAVDAVHPGCIRWTCCERAAAFREPNQSRFLPGAVAHGVHTVEQYSPNGLYTQKGPTLEWLLKN